MKKFFKEFKEFISRGSILDMAVGVIIGGAFNTIVTTLNKQILMPIVNWVLSFVSNGAEFCTVLSGPGTKTLAKYVSEGGVAADVTPIIVNGVEYYSVIYINWSAFVESVINFLFVALTLFIIVKTANSFNKKLHARQIKEAEEKAKLEAEKAKLEAEEKAKQPKPLTETDLLLEIRDLLANKESK